MVSRLKARKNSLTGRLMPTNPGGTDALLREILKMRGVNFEIDAYLCKVLLVIVQILHL